MFSRQKTQTDVKKSTQKLLDSKKDVPTRLKHLKLILDFVDGAEAKNLFCTHYSPIYHLVYEGIISAESSLKQRGVHRAQREELDSVLHLLEKILLLCPDLLQCRWQLHSLSRLMAKLNHPANSLKLRREAIRLFLIWYQCLGKSAPNYIHGMFSSLVPGLGDSQVWPPPSDPSWGITPLDITPVLPASSTEKQPDDLTPYLLECVLDYMVSQAPKIHWKEGAQMWAKSIDFLYERFKEFYLPRIFPNFNVDSDIYKPSLELPEPRKSADISNSSVLTCQVVFVKWIANYAHSVYRSTDCYQPTNVWSNKVSTVHYHYDEKKVTSTPPSSLHGDRDSMTSYSSIPSDVDANVLAKDVILGTRENINLLHEVFRRALLMNFVHSAAIRRVICVYKDWIQINVPELPVFMLEPEDSDSTDEASQPPSLDPPKNRLRTDSYYGAIGFNANNNREEYLSQLRAGAQKVLRVFFCNSASVFLHFQIPKHEAALALLEEQVDVCKRVLNIYRYAVMNTRMDPKTWEQLLIVMLHVTSSVLNQNQLYSGIKYPDTLGYKLASALFQTLIVSWVKASLNVSISIELWDQLQSVLAQLTVSDDLITEWAKTMETLTRVLSRHVYNLDLANLPLERLTEQKAKKKRGLQSGTFTKETFKQVSGVPEGTTFPRKRHTSSGTSSERKSLVFSPSTTSPQRKVGLKRSQSEGNILSVGKVAKSSSIFDTERFESGIQSPASRLKRLRKISRSADSIKKLNSKEAFILPNPVMQPDWAEISSSTASLENTSNIHVDEESTSVDGYGVAKAEMKGVIAGGSVKGWLPNVAAILWKRMLGILGDVNEFKNPKTHAHFFQILTDMWSTLYKVRKNQGVSVDNLSTPKPPELVPPLPLLAPWCLQALDLPDEFHRGKVLACALLCEITLSNQDVQVEQEYLCKFYATLHRCIINNNQEIVNMIVKQCGVRFVPKMLPGFSLLLLDLIQAAHSVLSSDDLKGAPRMEASTLLGTVLSVSSIFKELKVLQPNSLQFQPIQTQHTKLVLSYLVQTAKMEQTSQARAIALQSLTMYLCEQLMEIRHSGYPPPNLGIPELDYHNRLSEIFSVLLASARVVNRSVALVASDLLLLLSDFATEVSTFFPKLCAKILLGLKWSLQHALPLKHSAWAAGRPVEIEKRLYIALMLTLGEWCMRLPLEILLSSCSSDSDSLLSAVFEVLLMVVQGYQTPSEKGPLLSSLGDFNSSIPFDDLQTVDATRGQEKTQDTSRTINSLTQDLQTVKLAARSLMSHLLTQVGHFPITSGAARCSSIVSENDDLPNQSGDWADELSSRIFALPNLQMFALDNETILTMIELPAQESPGDNECSAFQSSQTQVRVILRDLTGKASWDASYLVPASTPCGGIESLITTTTFHPEELYFQSAMTGSFFPQMGPRLTVRHRHSGQLPTVDDSADDLDNLDDLLEYIGHTSPECQLRVGERLTVPWGPPPTSTQDHEDEVVASVVSQRNTELEYLMKVDMDVTMRAKPLSLLNALAAEGNGNEIEESMLSLDASGKNSLSSSFLLSRRLFSQLGLNGWEKRSTIHLLHKDEKLLRELKHLDAQKCRESHKIAVIYVAHGQEDKQSILFNTAGSEAYEDFVAGLGWEVELETHTGFMGGLHKNKNSGETAPYHATSFTEVIFHVATRLPSNTEESLLQKTRHLGNDEVHIVWSEHNRDYRRDIIPTEFCDVLIVIYPLQFGLYRVQISRKSEVPYFGPLYNEAVVNGVILPSLVRATAINASRARRSSLQYFQHHFQERSKCLSMLIQLQKVRTTFEQFATNVFCPLLPTASFQTGITNRSSGVSFSSTAKTSSTTFASHPLASALLDHSMSSSGSGSGLNLEPLPARRMTTAGPAFRFSTSSVYENVNLNLNLSPNLVRTSQGQPHGYTPSEASSNSAPVSPIPPVPPKRLSIKLGSALKPKLHTPPASPSSSLRSTPGTHSKQ